MAGRDLRKVQRVAMKAERVRAELRDAIVAAHESGESIRDIAPYAGLSPTQVHKLLDEAAKLKRDE